MNKVVGVLLAAGQSHRFGSNKCLALLPNRTPMGVQSAHNLAAHVDEMVVVIPPDNDAVKAVFLAEGFTTIVCRTAGLGMSESLKAGIRYFDDRPDLKAFVIGLADMPLIHPETYHAVVLTLARNTKIVSPQYQGKRGHPVGFSAQYRDELLNLQGDQGAKILFQKYPKDITLLEVDDPGIHQDFDTHSLFEQFFHEHSA